MSKYRAKIGKDTNGEYLITFPDIPEAATTGATKDEALANAVDALETALDFYFDERRTVPFSGKLLKGQVSIALPALVYAKVLLHNEMLAQGIKKAELARRLDMQPSNVERIFHVKHATKFETLETAFKKLGRELELSLS